MWSYNEYNHYNYHYVLTPKCNGWQVYAVQYHNAVAFSMDMFKIPYNKWHLHSDTTTWNIVRVEQNSFHAFCMETIESKHLVECNKRMLMFSLLSCYFFCILATYSNNVLLLFMTLYYFLHLSNIHYCSITFHDMLYISAF